MKKKIKGNQNQSTLGLVHLGCPKNQVDSEEMLAVLATDGWTLVGDPDDADVLVVNTCGFIESAKAESMDAIREALGRKKKGRTQKVVVAGCLAQRYAEQIAAEFPAVDAVVGLGQTRELPQIVRSTFQGKRPVISTPPPPEWQEIGSRLMTTPSWTTYLKIGEGCDHTCSFCAIPGFRGGWRSRPANLLLDELRSLAADGLQEAILIGQDTTLYGRESLGEWTLARLVREIGEIDGIKWQRLMYAHPGRINSEIIDLFGSVGNLAPYIDIPFQHGSDAVLKRMRRAGTTDRYLEIVRLLREVAPDIAIRSTFLVGFPGETEAEFAELLDFMKQIEPDHAGVFTYSHEDSTPAFEMENDVPPEVALERAQSVMELQAEISESRLQKLVSTEIDVLVEGRLEAGLYIGRSTRDAPEVDGAVTLSAGHAHPGTIVRARVTEVSTHDIAAEAVEADELALTRA